MSLEKDAELIKGYNDWVLLQRSKDVSPEAYLLDRAKEEALASLLKAIDFVTGVCRYVDEDTGAMLYDEMPASAVRDLIRILGADD